MKTFIQKFSLFLASLSVLFLSASMAVAPAYAFDPFSSACTANTGDSAVCVDKGNGQNGNNPIYGSGGLIYKITEVVAFIAGVAAIIVILVGSIKYVTSGGDANAASSAKNTILGAFIGLIIIIVAASLITFVVSKI
jgi:hypothetical protein